MRNRRLSSSMRVLVDASAYFALLDQDDVYHPEVLAFLRQAREEVRARTSNIKTEKDAEILANRFSREFVKDLAQERKVKFERK